jgi:hypothetical protein
MNAVPSSSEIQGRVAAGRLLSVTAGTAAASLDSFSGWLLSGFGAAYALLLANIEKVANFLDVAALRNALILFATATVAGVIARYLGAIVSAGAATSEAAAQLGKGLEIENPEVAARVILGEISKATFWPARLLVTSAFRNVERGDYAAGGRLYARLVQVQSWLVVLLALSLVSSIWTITRGLAV